MQQTNFFKSTPVLIALAIIALCCCAALATAAFLGLGGLVWLGRQAAPMPTVLPTLMVEETPTAQAITPAITPAINASNNLLPEQAPVAANIIQNLSTLEQATVPENNPAEIACRLEGKCDIPDTFPSGPFKVGDRQKFWVTNTDTAKNTQINASLTYETDLAYFWVQDGVSYSKEEAKALVDTFTDKIVPTDREFFGNEPNPGIDNDPHIYILYARGIGASTAGYFSSADALHPLVKQYSNGHEMFVFNADNSPLNDPYTYGVLAHEFQHMIHFGRDRNENSWINEGFSELAVLLNGYDPGPKNYQYTDAPDLQLTDWGADVGDNAPHYGASFLFTAYFLDRFGKEATQALVRDPANGLESIDNVLKAIGATDSITEKPIRADDLFMDWAITNYLLDPSVGDGRYAYKTFDSTSYAVETSTFETCPAEFKDTVNQYGVDYVGFACPGPVTLHFQGSTGTTVLPTDPYSGKMAFWSNKGDESDMTLTREFDFSQASGPLTLTYQAWYDLEANYDYAYVEISSDGGKTWKILTTPSGTAENPSGNSYGWGYNDKSDGWLKESVDLSQFTGQKVLIRFEYITDAAVNGEGFLVDDISIPEINYVTDFETSDGGWQGRGFTRIENALPQTFRLALITLGDTTSVEYLTVSEDQSAEVSFNLKNGDHAILVISGVTRFTRGQGSYSITVK